MKAMMLPLLVDTPYTQSMRYEKVQTFAIHLFGFRADQHHPLLPRPPWMWGLIVVAVLAAGWWRRGSTLVLMIMATVFALFFRFTRQGVLLRAAADDGEAAAMMGVSLRETTAWTFESERRVPCGVVSTIVARSSATTASRP